MDKNTLTHTTWECKYHIVFAPKIQETNYLRKYKSRCSQYIKYAMQKKRGRDYRGRVLQRSYTYAGKNTTESKCIIFYGILKR